MFSVLSYFHAIMIKPTILCLLISGLLADSSCPDCSLVDCLPEYTQDDCPEGTFLERDIAQGCCPACVQRLEAGDICMDKGHLREVFTPELPCTKNRYLEDPEILVESEEDSPPLGIPVIYLYECSRGLSCGKTTGQCEPNEESVCSKAKIQYNQWLDNQDCKNEGMDWEKSCGPNGLYSQTQIKSNPFNPDQRTFCFNPLGERIFGSTSGSAEEEATDCSCSRKRWELERNGHQESMLHCDSAGRFERVQCSNGRCWCMASENPNKATSKVVHENLRHLLPCSSVQGGKMEYIRRCESRLVGKNKVKRKLLRHGLSWLEPLDVRCDFDGSFSAANCDLKSGGVCRCVDKNNQKIMGNKRDLDGMNCNCARDTRDGLNHLECDPSTGNYTEIQTFGDIEYCVDEDGFQKTPNFVRNVTHPCALPKCQKRIEQCGECNRDCEASCYDGVISKK